MENGLAKPGFCLEGLARIFFIVWVNQKNDFELDS